MRINQVSRLLTNGLDTSPTTSLGDVVVCVLKAGHSGGNIWCVKPKQRAQTNQEPDDRHVCKNLAWKLARILPDADLVLV